MALCAHFRNTDFDSIAPMLCEALAAWERECRATSSAEAVREIVRQGHEKVQALLAADLPVTSLDPNFLRSIEFASGAETLPRLAYALDAYLGPFAAGRVNRSELALTSKLGLARLLPLHLRFPADASDSLGTLRYWHRILAGLVDESVPILLIAPLGGHWVDVIAGPATLQHLTCLRVTTRGVPLTSDVPFAMDDVAFQRAEALFGNSSNR